MSEVARLTLVTHALTEAVAAARFPADEPLSAPGERSVMKVGPSVYAERADLVLTAPELRTRRTAEILGRDAEIEAALMDWRCGEWAGRTVDELAPEDLMAWLTDPEHRPPSGESIRDLLDRVREWLRTLTATPRRVTAVTHPAVVRAAVLLALDAPARSFWRVDIPPLSATTLHGRASTWTLRATAHPLIPAD
ncbi:histidine phosphatase family protein [Nocardia pseudobrasiliensis]|uniref:Broad specificity phosphatase PhoE n=1 Tax=Nocardia pseudobrasiliensis TaxID=45979 RepID=A0A370HYR3_9NOCA|nr:histidine phosphatase family protein [Nocardia pseudobrasiliensis]RDI63646.1 broad specificity phosphatase PhoE [Nocardia pseudobrasiliensis]